MDRLGWQHPAVPGRKRDGFVSALDVLLVINRINTGSGEGKRIRKPISSAADAADQVMLDYATQESLQSKTRHKWARDVDAAFEF